MPYDVRFIEKEDIIEVISSGDLTKQDMERTRDEIIKICMEKFARKILVDATILKSTPAKYEMYFVLTGFPEGLKVAFVVSVFSEILNGVAFMEYVGEKQGQTVKIFRSREAAKKWLQNNEKDKI